MGGPQLSVLVVWLLIAWGGLYNLHELSKIEQINKFFQKVLKFPRLFQDKREGAFEIAYAANVLLKVFGIVLFSFMSLYAIIWATGESESLGQLTGERHYERLSKPTAPVAAIALDSGGLIQGLPIICSERYCGILVAGEVQLFLQYELKVWAGRS